MVEEAGGHDDAARPVRPSAGRTVNRAALPSTPVTAS